MKRRPVAGGSFWLATKRIHRSGVRSFAMLSVQFTSFLTTVSDLVEKVFGGDYPKDPLHLYQVAARAIVVYVVGVAIVRIGKSRIVSRMTPIDVIIGFILGSLLSRGITGHASLSGTVAASIAIVACHWVF